jgi:hypothetical protein
MWVQLAQNQPVMFRWEMTQLHTANGNSNPVDPNEAVHADRLAKIEGILSGEKSIQLTLQFLYTHNR